MLRFASSPTRDMNIEDLRIAIFNYILSKQLNENLLIKIDDANKQKNIEGKEKDILEILSLFSIDHERVVYQSENLKYHQKITMQLMGQKKAFACFCSDEKIKELDRYDGFCSTLSDETVLNCNAPFKVRIKEPESKIIFTDLLKDEISYDPITIDSFEILNHDKTPTVSYAGAIDDMLYDISIIVRSEENILETPKQIYVRSLLGYDKKINYLHLPIISNKKEIPLVGNLIDEGFLPSAIANYLVSLGNKTPNEIFTLEEAVQWLDVKNISKEKVFFDINKLKEINIKHLKLIDELRLSKILGFADSDIGKLAKLYLKEVSTIKEIKHNIDLVFNPKNSLKGFDKELSQIKECLQSAPFFDKFEQLKEFVKKKINIEEKKLLNLLTYTLTGRENGPNINDVYPLIKNYLGEIVK